MGFQRDTQPVYDARHLLGVPLPSSTVLDEEATLIAILRTWGISYLTGGLSALPPSECPADLTSAPSLLLQLVRCQNSRVRDATISLLILHPELAGAVQNTLQQGYPQETETLAVLTLATLYLQRFWWYRLTLALGHPPAFPEEPFTSLWRTRKLPSPAAFCGRWGVLALEKREQARSGLPLTFSGDWQNQSHHLLLQEEAKQRPTPVFSSNNMSLHFQNWTVPLRKLRLRWARGTISA